MENDLIDILSPKLFHGLWKTLPLSVFRAFAQLLMTSMLWQIQLWKGSQSPSVAVGPHSAARKWPKYEVYYDFLWCRTLRQSVTMLSLNSMNIRSISSLLRSLVDSCHQTAVLLCLVTFSIKEKKEIFLAACCLLAKKEHPLFFFSSPRVKLNAAFKIILKQFPLWLPN